MKSQHDSAFVKPCKNELIFMDRIETSYGNSVKIKHMLEHTAHHISQNTSRCQEQMQGLAQLNTRRWRFIKIRHLYSENWDGLL